MNLFKALVTVSGLTFISRILGFVRDFVIAYTFKTGMYSDAFFVAFKLPNLLRRLFAEGAFSQAFVPILGDYKNRRGLAATKTLVDRVATVLLLALVVVTLFGMVGAAGLVYISAPGFLSDPGKFALTVTMTRITFPYIMFMSLLAFAAAILNTWSRFAVPAVAPALLNLSFIVGALFFTPYFDPPVLVLAWAVFVGGFLQLLLQWPALVKIGMLPRLIPDLRACWRDEGVRRILRLMAPAVLGVSVSQISLLINTVFASFLASGSVSWLYFADRLMEFPAGMLGAALGTVLLPSLSKAYATDDAASYRELLDWGLRLTVLLAAPAALGLAMLALPLIASLFMHGAFTLHDAMQTRLALMAYGVGLVPLILIKVLAPGFYARQNIRTPVRIAIISLLVTQGLNLVLVWHLRHAGLALSISLAAWVNAGLLYRGLRKAGIYTPQPGWGRFVMRVALALVALGIALWLSGSDDVAWQAYRAGERALRLSFLVVLGIVVYFVTLWLFGFRRRDFIRQTT